MSLSATAPTMPSGYTYKAYAGAIYNDSSGDFVTLYQIGNRVRCKTGSSAGLTGATAQLLDISALVPPNAIMLHGTWEHSSSGNSMQVHPVTYTPAQGVTWAEFTRPSAGVAVQFNCPIETAQTVYFSVSAGTGELHIQGWEY